MTETHDHHEALEGFDARQILHDGCAECERRAQSVERALGHMDNARFEKAWRRAYDEFASGGNPNVGRRSRAEMPVITALWAVQLHLQRRGIPLDGVPPSRSAVEQMDEQTIRVAGALLGVENIAPARLVARVMREVAAAGRPLEDQLAVAEAALAAWGQLR